MILYDCPKKFLLYFYVQLFYYSILSAIAKKFLLHVKVSKTVGDQLFNCNPVKVSKTVAISKLSIGFNVLIGKRSLFSTFLLAASMALCGNVFC